MFAIHLGMVELEGQFQCGLKQVCFIFHQDQKRVIETTGVEIDGPFDGRLGQGRGTDDHIVLAGFIRRSGGGHLAGEATITPVKGG